jgi:ABC-2 type transport system ATP-binding protein
MPVMSHGNPIEITDLRKDYGSFTAVDDLSLSVEKNSFTGLLGPNGAGKSTTLKIMCNLMRATSGSVRLNGIDVADDPKGALQDVGTVVETPEFYLYLTPRETFRYVGELIGMRREAISSQTDEILEKVKMKEWEDRKLGTFSKGMRQRVALGQALMDDPKIIILDEPTSGLDPRGMAEVREILKNLRSYSDDLTVLMSSHILHEVGDLCDRVAIMDHGRLLVHDDIGIVNAPDGVRNITLTTLEPLSQEELDMISGLPDVVSAKNNGNETAVCLRGGPPEQNRFFEQVVGLDIGAYSLADDAGDALESTYLRLVKESR